MHPDYPVAPSLDVSEWFNTERSLDLVALRGRVVLLYAFQMLCPGCVARSLPQAQAVSLAFASSEVAVVGLHTVFEHHEAMQPAALKAFIHEYRLQFPIGVDRASDTGAVPRTMQTYQLRGTPSLIVIDRAGRIRRSVFGDVDDLQLGFWLGSLLAEITPTPDMTGCRDSGDLVTGKGHSGTCTV